MAKNMNKRRIFVASFLLGASVSLFGQTNTGGITPEMLDEIKQAYKNTPQDRAIHNAIANNDINKLAVNNASKNNFGAIEL